MTLGTLTLQEPNSMSVIYDWNGYEHESAHGDLTKFVKNYRKKYNLKFEDLTDTDTENIRNEIISGAIFFIFAEYSINTTALVNISEEDVPMGGGDYRRIITLSVDDQTVYSIGGELPTTGLSSGIRINEIYHKEPQSIKILNDIQNVDMDGQDGLATRDYMHNRLRMKIDWNNLPNADIVKIVQNILTRVYHNITHELMDETVIIDITKEDYGSKGIGNLGLVITSISGEV
jgi:hypothetical protein